MCRSTLTPAVCLADPFAGSVGVTHSLPLSLFAPFQDRSAVFVLSQPEPELAGEEHPPPGQQQHAGHAHLCQLHTHGEFIVVCKGLVKELLQLAKICINSKSGVWIKGRK